MKTFWQIGVVFLGTWAAATALGGEKVVLRTSAGRFLGAAKDGSLRAERLYPTPAEQFELEKLPGERITLKAPDGRYVYAADHDGRLLRADSPRAVPGEPETFQLVPVEGNRTGMKVAGFRALVVFDRAAPPPAAAAGVPAAPLPGETIEIFRAGDLPDALQTILAIVVQGVLKEEVGDKEYDQTRTRKIEKYVDLPSPALNNLKHTKRTRILATEEQTQVKARLDGPPHIAITHMPYLKGYVDPGAVLLMFVADARLAFRGQVHYKMPNVISAGTNYQATAKIALVGEVRAHKSGEKVDLASPEVRRLQIDLDLRDLSNDVLNTVREPIEDVVNREIRHNDARIREQANKALAKAIRSQQFEHPLLKYVGLP